MELWSGTGQHLTSLLNGMPAPVHSALRARALARLRAHGCAGVRVGAKDERVGLFSPAWRSCIHVELVGVGGSARVRARLFKGDCLSCAGVQAAVRGVAPLAAACAGAALAKANGRSALEALAAHHRRLCSAEAAAAGTRRGCRLGRPARGRFDVASRSEPPSCDLYS